MQLKSIVRFPVDIRRARKLLNARKASLDSFPERPIVLDLVTPQLLFDCGRHFASLAHYAQASGSPFLVRCSRMLLACIARKVHGREMLAAPYARWIPPQESLPENAFVLRDSDPEAVESGARMLIGRDIADDAPVMPYPMHPATLPFAAPDSLRRLQQTTGRRCVFFAGNQKPKYGDAKMQREFGLLSRLRILATLQRHFPERIAASMDSAVDSRAIVLSDSRQVSIQASQWLPTLAQAQFFICCPGASQPTCHNLIEAMSVGTIPLIEYGDRVTPQLQDGVNAITFRGERGLVAALNRIDSLSPQQIADMSRNAAGFYDRHLCGAKFLAGLRDGRIPCPAARVCMPFHERNLFASTPCAKQSRAA